MPRVTFPQSYCRAGAARRDITPPVGIYHRMWGAATHERSTGVHRPLLATALALAPEPGEGNVAANRIQVIVSVDHCLLWPEEMDRLLAHVCGVANLNASQLQIALSHTHAAGLMDPARADLPGGELIAPYLDSLSARIAEAALEAISALEPANIVYGQGHCSLAAHRDFWDADHGLFACGYNPDGPANETVLTARVSNSSGQTIATIVNYACHPTTLAWDNTLISPDYIGALRETVETATGGLCVFLQGASGDLGPKQGFVGDTQVADRNGQQVAYAALEALANLPAAGVSYDYAGPVVSGATIGVWQFQPLDPEVLCEKHRFECESFAVPLAYRADLPDRQATEAELARWQTEEQAANGRGDAGAARDARAQAERMRRQLTRLRSLPAGPTVPVPASVWRLGDAFWVFVAGEHYSLLERELRARFGDHPVFVSTVTNGWRPGYLPTRDTYGRGIYQESIAIVEPGSLERLIEKIAERMLEAESRASAD